MWYFIAGLLIGGIIGVAIMCIMAVAKKADKDEDVLAFKLINKRTSKAQKCGGIMLKSKELYEP